MILKINADNLYFSLTGYVCVVNKHKTYKHILAWEPSVAHGTQSYSRRLPALE